MVQRVLTNIAVTENVQKSKVKSQKKKRKKKKKKKSEPVAIIETIANKDDFVRTA